jgi:CheY-like chemotaxis protein
MPNKAANILLAEDNPGDIFLVKEALQAHEIAGQLHVMRDGDAAIRFIDAIDDDDATPCPQLALLDLNLPKRNGWEILARLRQSSKCRGIPVAMMSSWRPPESGAEVANADYFFWKPSSYDEFMALGGVLKELLERGEK